ncbi:hypothetical protein VTH82DRAFT_5368 [Thermothelomyces myriococcoides]
MSSEKARMEIQNPRRILAVSLIDSAQYLSDVIKDLTGIPPSPSPQAVQDNGGDNRSNDHNNNNNNNNSSSSSSNDQAPEAETGSGDTIAGTTHPLTLSTPYYTASVPIWLDLVASPAEWSAAFLSPEAKEVLDVLGGVLVVFALPPARASPPPPPLPSSSSSSLSPTPPTSSATPSSQETARVRARELITHVGKVVREGLGGWEWDGVGLAVGVGPGGGPGGLEDADGGELDEWEDLCAESGLEFVHVPRAGAQPGNGKGAEEDKRNEFGERVGMARVLEALKANDWSGGGTRDAGDFGEEDDEKREKGKGNQDDNDDYDFDDFDPEKLDFGFDKEDFAGLREAILSGGSGAERSGLGREAEENEDIDEEDVQQLERLMLKLQAVRDASAGLPEEQRKRMAARAVGEVMREL